MFHANDMICKDRPPDAPCLHMLFVSQRNFFRSVNSRHNDQWNFYPWRLAHPLTAQFCNFEAVWCGLSYITYHTMFLQRLMFSQACLWLIAFPCFRVLSASLAFCSFFLCCEVLLAFLVTDWANLVFLQAVFQMLLTCRGVKLGHTDSP